VADKKKPKKGGAPSEGGVRLTAHPRAQRQIAAAKGWGGVGCFALVMGLSLRAGLPITDSALRAIFAGMVGYTVAWGVAVTVWRQVALAQVEQLRREMLAAQQRQRELLAAAPPEGDDR
jgi:uncharacterized membrane protein YccC